VKFSTSLANELYNRVVESYAEGYPQLAAFMSSTRNFMHYRGFHDLHSRVLLAQQHDIEVLEGELDRIDDWDSKYGRAGNLRNKTRDDRQNSKAKLGADYPYNRTRPEVIADLKQQLVDYGELNTGLELSELC
jgi:hypothetical protein